MRAIRWINRFQDNSFQEIEVDLDNLEAKNTYQLVEIMRQLNMIEKKLETGVGFVVDKDDQPYAPHLEFSHVSASIHDEIDQLAVDERNVVRKSKNMMSGYRFRKFGTTEVGKNLWPDSRYYLRMIVNAETGEVDKNMLGQWAYTKHDWGKWIWGLEVNLNKRKNGKGWTIHCSLSATYYNNYESISDEKSKDYDPLYVKLADALAAAGIKMKHKKTCTTFFQPMKEMIFVNETKVGVRCLTTKVDKNGFKPLWGQSLSQQLKFKFLQGEVQFLIDDAYRCLEKVYKKEDVLSICENLSFNRIFPDDYRYSDNPLSIQLHGMTQDELRYLSGAKNIHQALNNAFGTPVEKMGKEESRYIFLEIPVKENSGITRRAFGGQQEFKHWHQLCSAVKMVRMFKAFGPNFFEQMKIDFVLPPIPVIHKVERLGGDQNYAIYPTRSMADSPYFGTYPDVQNMQKYFKIFGATTAYKNQILQTFTWDETDTKKLEELAKEPHRTHATAACERQNRINHLLNQVADTLSSLKKIPVGNRRKAVIEQVKRQKYDFDQTHDYVVTEAMKYLHEARPTTNTKLINSFNGKEIIDGVIFRAPKTTHDLYLWGTQQNNCIGTSWADTVADRRQFIVGFEYADTGKWIGHARFILLDSGKQLDIQEFRGKGEEPREDLRKELVKWMKSNLVKKEN